MAVFFFSQVIEYWIFMYMISILTDFIFQSRYNFVTRVATWSKKTGVFALTVLSQRFVQNLKSKTSCLLEYFLSCFVLVFFPSGQIHVPSQQEILQSNDYGRDCNIYDFEQVFGDWSDDSS